MHHRYSILALLLLACGSAGEDGSPTLGTDGGGTGGGGTGGGPLERTVMTLADGVDTADSIAVDANTVYVASNPPNAVKTLFAVPKAGGPPRTVTEPSSSFSGGPLCHTIATDGESVFFIDREQGVSGRQLFKAPTSGGAAVSITVTAASFDPLSLSGCVAYEAGFVYFSGDGAIYRVPPAGGTPEVVAGTSTGATEIAVAGGHVCYIKEAQAIGVVPVTGGTPKILGGELGNTDTVAASSRYCYAGNGAVTRFPVEGGGGRQVLVEDVGSIRGLVADEAGVYWTATTGQGEGTLGIALGDDPLVEMYESVGVRGVAVDDTHVFFTSDSEAALRAVQK